MVLFAAGFPDLPGLNCPSFLSIFLIFCWVLPVFILFYQVAWNCILPHTKHGTFCAWISSSENSTRRQPWFWARATGLYAHCFSLLKIPRSPGLYSPGQHRAKNVLPITDQTLLWSLFEQLSLTWSARLYAIPSGDVPSKLVHTSEAQNNWHLAVQRRYSRVMDGRK